MSKETEKQYLLEIERQVRLFIASRPNLINDYLLQNLSHALKLLSKFRDTREWNKHFKKIEEIEQHNELLFSSKKG